MKLLLLLILLISPSLCEAEERLYTRIDQLTCEDTQIQSSVTCTEDSFPGGYVRNCVDQHFLFTNRKTGKSMTVKSSADFAPISNKIVDRNTRRLSAFGWSWACVKGKNRSYVIILYSNGGKCSGCEWADIHSLDGKLLASDKGEPLDDRIKMFKNIYMELGLPVKWPRSSFANIQY
jgi:hypothetical protein